MRQPMDLRAAFKRAQEQTAAEENTDSDNTIDFQHAFNMANAEYNAVRGIDGSPSPAPRSFRREFKATVPSKNNTAAKKNDLNTHLERFDRTHQLTGRDGPITGLFTKNHIEPTVSGTRRAVAKTVNDGGLDDNAERQKPDFRTGSPRNQEKAKEGETLGERPPVKSAVSNSDGADIPVPSIEYGYASDDRPSPDLKFTNMSPEKSMNWHLDADFTAGDLQFSESPRITVRKPSSDQSRQTGTQKGAPEPRRSNDRLDQIQQRETEAARATFPEYRPVGQQMNPRLDEIRLREMEALSRRAVASSRLDEIRIRNSEPRSESPEPRKDLHKKPSEERLAHLDIVERNALKPSSDLDLREEPVRDTPAMVLKSSSGSTLDVGDQHRLHGTDEKRGAPLGNDSYDLLRRLARATSSSSGDDVQGSERVGDNPTTENTEVKQLHEARKLSRSPLLHDEGRVRNREVKNSKDRPTVGFADLMRIPSSDSVEEKRTSLPTSEVDPTDRITAELNLFAPLDNYSEKGSIRAPSPIPSEPIDEETPRPPKIDPLTQPTPRVTGAYVDTPATVRVKGEDAYVESVENHSVVPETDSLARGRTSNVSPTSHAMKTGATGRTRSVKRTGQRSSSAPTAPHHLRSSSRRRRPLVNTAKPPTVREDIIAILRANNIDDSTLENLDSILADQEVDDQELKQMVNDTVLKVEDDLDVKFSDMSDRERELEAYDRMSKSLQTGLLGIRSAKKGIERLEDKVTHTSGQDDSAYPRRRSSPKSLAQPPPLLDEAAPVLISVPRLYCREPKFKLTTLGIITFWTIIWYALECTFCFLYAGPEYICTPSVPCDWSPHEPYFPYTMPFMLDEWTTGGKGRILALRVGEEVGDILAEISDWITNTDFTQFDERYMDVWQRKRHKRRLRKHGLIPKWTEPLGYKARFPEWQAAKTARELAQELGLDEEDETMSADEVVRYTLVVMASLTNVDAPGAYPATPSNEEPRGRNNTERSTHPSLAQSVGATTPSNQYPTQQTPFSKETPRSSRISAQPSGTKPGAMTDAYSRVGTQDGAFAQGSNYTYDNVSASLSPYDANSQRYSDTGNTLLDLDTPTNIVPPANTPAETTALNSISNTAANSHGDHSNKARSGLRGSSASEHNEPYWGDIPFGTGVYNGVTGHGSDEPTTQHNSLRDQHSARTNPRIYNGVTGHGSENSASPQIFKHDQDMTTDDYSHQQRAFPLTGNVDTATTTRLEDAHERMRDSRFKEGFAGAGTTASGDYATHKYPNRDNDREAETTDETLNGLRRGEPDTLSYPRGQKGDEALNKHEGAGRALPHRTFAAVPTQDYNKRDMSERKPVETRKGKRGVEDSSSAALPAHDYAEGQELEKQPLEEDRRKEYSNPGYYGAAAAGAGAGAYGMHKYANRANAKERSSTALRRQ
ncbi:hypothetical protein NUW58_g8514 [Xylaria curta]|uniref:Uncharacterized protein n=1 Tax=Xylaria curta TaxID=42375 RepID=A0ACC1N8E0_9PEZI|nr:hypothetical protein NUW58_g8514 [Xylaria curta]